MSATAAQIAQLRRMVNEPTDTTYDDDSLSGYIESYPLLDELGEVPYTWDTATTPPTQDDNDDWIPTYDLHAAAADIWQEKAAVVSVDFDYSADGGRLSRSQVYAQYMKQCRYHRSRRKAASTTMHVYPQPTRDTRRTWVANKLEDID